MECEWNASKSGIFIYHNTPFEYGEGFLDKVIAHEIGHTTPRNYKFSLSGGDADFDANQTMRLNFRKNK